MTETMLDRELEGWCFKCKLTLTHMVAAMKEEKIHRVKCSACEHVHAFRQKPKTRKSASPKPVRPTDYELQMRGRDESDAIPYRLDGSYDRDDMINHSKLGVGLVKSLRDARKMEVLFAQGPVLLMHSL